jgi:hypothetical protein
MAQDAAHSSSSQSEVIVKVDHLSPLPEELIDNICAWLPTFDMRNFRLTSRILKEKSNHAFTACYFKITQIILTRESLETLINKIANDSRYGPSVKTLQVCLLTFPPQAKSELNGLPLTKKEIEAFEMISLANNDTDTEDTLPSADILKQRLHSTIKRTRRRLYGQHHHSQNTLRTQCLDIKLLTEALRRLPALESITISGHLDPINPPWGARKIQHDIGMWPPFVIHMPTLVNLSSGYNYHMYDKEVVQYFQRFCKHTMAVVFGSLLRSGIKLKQTLKIEVAPYTFRIPEKSDSRRLGPTTTPARTFSSDRIQDLLPAFSELRELSLRIFDYRSYCSPREIDYTNIKRLSWIEKFVPVWSSIRVLSIAGTGHGYESSIFGDLSATSSTLVSNHLGSAVFPHLRVLRISDTRFRAENIIQMLQNHRYTLQEFATHYCIADSHLEYMSLLRSLTSMPALVNIELIRGSLGARHNNSSTLDEIASITNIEIRKGTPAAFQDALESKIVAVLANDIVFIDINRD